MVSTIKERWKKDSDLGGSDGTDITEVGGSDTKLEGSDTLMGDLDMAMGKILGTALVVPAHLGDAADITVFGIELAVGIGPHFGSQFSKFPMLVSSLVLLQLQCAVSWHMVV